MSNIAIQGAATGTGVFTLASPATNTNRTLTLPDEAGTVATEAKAISDATALFTGSNVSIAGSGYQKLPSGLIIQWGFVSGASSTNLTFTLPIAFPNAGLCATATVAVTTAFTAETGIDSLTTTSVVVNHRAGAPTSIFIIVIGW